MDKIECHSSTPKKDLIAFAEKHKGKKIKLHYDYNFSHWEDDIIIFDTGKETDYNRIMKLINENYIHNIYVFCDNIA